MAAGENPIQRVTAAFTRLSEREKRLVLLTAAAAFIFVVLGGSFLVSSMLDKRAKRVAMRRDEISQLDALRDQYQEAVAAEAKSKSRITTNTASLFSLMQKSAGDVGLSLNDLNERRSPVKDAPDVTEVTVDVNLKEITVDKLDTLLEKIEGKRNDGVIKVTKLKVKTRFDHDDMLETNMTVSTWKSAASTPSTGAQ
jgi:type II secretory pathway component PulM